VWNPGDQSDIVEGQAGTDTMRFNGSNAAEKINLTANGSRLLFTRDVANVAMDVNGVERVKFNALGGADRINVGDLKGTGVDNVAIDLANPAGSGTGDGAPDQVVVTGTNGADHISLTGGPGPVTVGGLAATVEIAGAEFANDRLNLETLTGNDTVHSKLAPNTLTVFVNGSVL
jgi:hypothetical protein